MTDPSWQSLLRLGWWARGLCYVGVGLLALGVASGVGTGREDADQAGAIELVATADGGWALVGLLGIGFGLFALLEAAAFFSTDADGIDAAVLRVGKAVGVVVHSGLAWTAATLAVRAVRSRPADTGQAWSVERATAFALDQPLGRLAVAAAAAVVAVVAARRLRRVRSGGFSDDLNLRAAGDTESLIETAGRVGELGRALAFCLIAYFLSVAAWRGSERQARGLDAALREASDGRAGRFLVVVVAFGMVSYGVFCAASASRRDLDDL